MPSGARCSRLLNATWGAHCDERSSQLSGREKRRAQGAWQRSLDVPDSRPSHREGARRRTGPVQMGCLSPEVAGRRQPFPCGPTPRMLFRSLGSASYPRRRCAARQSTRPDCRESPPAERTLSARSRRAFPSTGPGGPPPQVVGCPVCPLQHTLPTVLLRRPGKCKSSSPGWGVPLAATQTSYQLQPVLLLRLRCGQQLGFPRFGAQTPAEGSQSQR